MRIERHKIDIHRGRSFFHYTVCDRVFPQSRVLALRDEFPLSFLRPVNSTRQPGKYHLRNDKPEHKSAVRQLRRRYPAWDEFLEAIQKDYRAIFGLALGSMDHDYLQIEISAIEAGGCVTPHADSAVKRAAGVFYIPPKGWRERWGGELCLFKHKKTRGRKSLYPTWDEVELLDSPKYTSNRIVCFQRNRRFSQHGVLPGDWPEGMYRQSVGLTLMKRGT